MISPHIKKIVLGEYKAIDSDTAIDNLGQINIFCGKNNSGKTSILEAFLQPHNHFNITFRITNQYLYDALERFVFLREINLSGQSDEYGAFWRQLREEPTNDYMAYINSFLVKSTKQIDFEWNYRDFVNSKKQYLKTIKKVFFSNSSNIETASYSVFFQTFLEFSHKILMLHVDEPKYKILYIPSERVPNIEIRLNDTEPKSRVFANNSNLIYNLFHIKNTPVNSTSYKLYEKLYQDFTEISGCHFNLVLKTIDKLFYIQLQFSNNDGEWIDAQNSGLGLRDLLVILCYINLENYNIILLEEPESHLHPEIQRKLLQYLRSHSNKQFLITTHSNVFLDRVYVDKIFHTKLENKSIVISDASRKAEVLHDLGYSVAENLVADMLVLVEGISDIPVLEEFLLKMDIWGNYNIKMLPICGDNMSTQDLTIFTESYGKYKTLALIDRDDQSQKIRDLFLSKCKEVGIECVKLERYAIENYFSSRALKIIFPNKKKLIPSKIDPNKKLVIEQINIKRRSRDIAKVMKLEEIKGTDLHKFLLLIGERSKNT